MSFNPTFQRVNGSGKPVLVVVKADPFWTSFGSTVFVGGAAPYIQEGLASAVNVSSSVAASDSIIAAAAHGLLVGQRFLVAGHTGSTPDINGEQDAVVILSTTQVSINVDITVGGGAAGTIRRTPDYRNVQGGQRVSSFKVTGSVAEPVWARVFDVDNTNKIIYLDPTIGTDGWVGGLPTNGQVITVDGWVIQLPYCYSLVETFTPEQLVHKLFRARIESKQYGYRYQASLDYAQWISADTLVDLEDALNLGEDDKLVLIPRIDVPGYSYNVKWQTVPQNISRYGKGPGHKGLTCKFEGTNLYEWPIATAGYGYAYATDYGTGL